jgi:capsular polysaccharide export protein
VVFVPLQVQRDTNILFHSDHIKTMRQLVSSVADAASGSDMTVVVRRHPEEVDTLESFPVASNLHYIDDGTADEWCDYADLVVTVNSTVGLTALRRGKPVIALGRSIYSNKGLCREARPDQLRALLRDEETYVPPDASRVQRFLRVLLGRHTAVPGRGPSLIAGIAADSSSQYVPFHPRGVDARWVADAWRQQLAAVRSTVGTGTVHVANELAPTDTLDLTYRNNRLPVSFLRLKEGVGALLQIPPGRVTVSSSATTPSTTTVGRSLVVVAAQSATPTLQPRPLLVVDQYM